MKKNKLFYLTLIITFIPLIVNLTVYPHMPDKVPVIGELLEIQIGMDQKWNN